MKYDKRFFILFLFTFLLSSAVSKVVSADEDITKINNVQPSLSLMTKVFSLSADDARIVYGAKSEVDKKVEENGNKQVVPDENKPASTVSPAPDITKSESRPIYEPNDYGESYAFDAIKYGAENGWLFETQKGHFDPHKNIQRFEFIYMVNRAFGFTDKAKVTYTDIKKSALYYDDVAVTEKADYLYVFDGNRFEPEKYFYRWELPFILSKAMKKDFSDTKLKSFYKYSDAKRVPSSARGAVAYFISKGWMKPQKEKYFGARDILTKEETVFVLYNLAKDGVLK